MPYTSSSYFKTKTLKASWTWLERKAYLKMAMSDSEIKREIIDDLLKMQGIETNPGTEVRAKVKPRFNLQIRTYNCNGLGNSVIN